MITEKESNYSNIEQMSVAEIISHINNEDKSVALAIEKALPQIEKVIDVVIEKMQNEGRLFYIGSGTSGRLGIIDAAECPPTFGVDYDTVIGLIAGGDKAIRKAQEHAEDSFISGWEDLLAHELNENDFVIGISASGNTPYVVGALQKCSQYGISTACITNNENTPLAKEALIPIEIITGPEFITGSTRMKAGTATKMILNMISTTVMIKLGKVKGNKMIDMKLLNNKLIERGTKIIMDTLSLDHDEANALLLKKGSVRKAIENPE
ncbi:MAG TPA: N-acetylmuramic acid 6-phosphate etherase [Bacteroidales bacterium]|nr:N-acetylmuramic acid 6-phosphate etherase [Bacteroidales bacterium]HPS17041.1 N-acetylmuramic acid 6-phosphate etherase [Bacteroidales bacterium]